MGADTRIEWCDATFNPWTGCQKVSPACDHCYAETQAKRAPATFGGWGPGAERKRTSESYWRQPLLWNKRAAKDGTRPRVFCASMADVFDNAVPEDWRAALWALIASTGNLDWLLLTKRPQNIARMLPFGDRWNPREPRRPDDGPWPNVWLGTTVENQAEADRRIPHLLAVPAAKRFLSCEPLLGPVNLTRWLRAFDHCPHDGAAANSCEGCDGTGGGDCGAVTRACIDWIIAGGESGPKARPSHPDWFRSLRDQCQAAGVPFFFKQVGEFEEAAPSPDNLTLRTPSGLSWPGDDAADILLNTAAGYRGRPMQIDGAPRFWASGDGRLLHRTGKKAAGAMLDAREWREVPG
jgi:protein gp37